MSPHQRLLDPGYRWLPTDSRGFPCGRHTPRRASVLSLPIMTVGLLLLLFVGPLATAQADPLDPLAYASLGAFPTAPGNYIYNGFVLTGPGGTFSAVFADNAGDPDQQEGNVAIFDFDSIALRSDQTISVMLSPGFPQSRFPLALLSRGNVTIAGSIFAFGAGGGPLGPGVGQPGIGGFAGGGGGGTFGNGDLAHALTGGSGGGRGGDFFGFVGASPGAGGGVVEIGALGSIKVNGGIFANGQFGSNGFTGQGGGGGGSGGGIFLHGDSVDLSGVLDVTGGQGGDGGPAHTNGPDFGSGGGGGGGGRVLIDVTGFEGFANNNGSILLTGGAGGRAAEGGGLPGFNGPPGEFSLNGPLNMDTPEPASFVLTAIGLLGLIGLRSCQGGGRH